MRSAARLLAILSLSLLQSHAQTSAPASVTPSVEERTVSFDSSGTSFPGTLTLPKMRKTAVPIVVMVAGSGPQDADESIGPNKPLRDIALDLAAQGIASLRYPKRTKLAPATMTGDHMNLDWEVTRDAVAALQYASALKEIDAKRVFVLGHSLGGTMAPEIATERLKQQPGSVAGVILLAPAVLPLDQTITRQVLKQNELAGATPEQLAQVQQMLAAMFAEARNPATPADKMVGMGALTLPEVYWRDMLAVDPAGVLKQLALPSLIIRGTKDIQVAQADYDAILPAQSGAKSAHQQIPGLNHLFMPVDGDSTGKEYMVAGHVSPLLTAAIVQWIAAVGK